MRDMSTYWTSDKRDAIQAALQTMADQNIVERIWTHDHTVWKQDPTEISNRLGWLEAHVRGRAEMARLTALHDQLLKEGYTHALLLGMGGSSLAPEMFARVFGAGARGL